MEPQKQLPKKYKLGGRDIGEDQFNMINTMIGLAENGLINPQVVGQQVLGMMQPKSMFDQMVEQMMGGGQNMQGGQLGNPTPSNTFNSTGFPGGNINDLTVETESTGGGSPARFSSELTGGNVDIGGLLSEMLPNISDLKNPFLALTSPQTMKETFQYENPNTYKLQKNLFGRVPFLKDLYK